MEFENAGHVPAGSTIDVDICIVGSGAAGIAMARELDGTKLRVLVLEAGGLERDEAMEEECFAVEHLGTPFANPLPTRGRWYGGSTNLWFGRLVRFDPIDFEERPWVPYSGWPLPYEELERWMPRAARLLAVPGFERAHISHWAMHRAVDVFVREAGGSLGVCVWADGLYMGPFNRDAIRQSPNVRMLLEATATELVPNEASTAIEALEVVGPRGNRFTVKAGSFVLAAGGLENPRLLLVSRRRSPQGVGNDHDLVGRFYMDHPRTEGVATVDLRSVTDEQLEWLSMLGDHRTKRYGRVQFRLTFPPEMQRSEQLLNSCLHADFAAEIHASEGYLAAKRLIDRARGKASVGIGIARDVVAAAKNAPELLAYGADKLLHRARPSTMYLIDQMDQEPDPESRVTLDWDRRDRWGMPKLRLNWRIGESTFHTQRRMHRFFREILERRGIRTLKSAVLDRPDENSKVIEMKHPSGTTRMSASPSKGVVDANLRVHGVHNLYVVGSSTFPTVGHANPTLSIVAFAVRLADHLARAASVR